MASTNPGAPGSWSIAAATAASSRACGQGSSVDVREVAAGSHIQVLSKYAECPPERDALLVLAGDDPASAARYRSDVLDRHISVIDLLEQYRSCALPFNLYLEFLPPLKPRYYSISSAPAVDPRRCSVTVGVLDAPARSGQGRYHGVCSWYLAQQSTGATIDGFTKAPNTPFRPPANLATPIIMVGAGTGLAPYRGFLQERAALKARGASVGPGLLFFGCRNPQQDDLYADELAGFERDGVAQLACAFSRLEGQPRTCVQDQFRARGDDVWGLLEQGGVVYVCVNARHLATDVRRSFAALYEDRTGADDTAAEAWLADLAGHGRYVAGVWPRT